MFDSRSLVLQALLQGKMNRAGLEKAISEMTFGRIVLTTRDVRFALLRLLLSAHVSFVGPILADRTYTITRRGKEAAYGARDLASLVYGQEDFLLNIRQGQPRS